MVNTKTAPRRELSLGSMGELAAELDRIEAAEAAGTLRVTGNWSAGQICNHVAILCEGALDGFESPLPLLLRPMKWIAILFIKKKALSGAAAPAGNPTAPFLKQEAPVSTAEGVARLRRVCERVAAGERFTHPSPLFGRMTHDEWTTLHLGHASLHLSFIHFDA